MIKSSIFKKKITNSSIKTSAASAPAVSPLNTPFSNNSRASIAAVAELSECLDFMFDQVKYQEEPGDLLQLHLSRLSEEAAKYRNARLDETFAQEWTCSSEVSQLVYAACQCSNLVYGPLKNQDSDLVRVLDRTPSFTGTSKAFSIWKVDSLKALVVSVRGTACVADHMVNLNAEAVDASSILGLPSGVSAHKGFLTCAKAIRSMVQQELVTQVEADNSIRQVVFTGHSAGGAVSSLLFLNLAFNTPIQMSNVTMSLATFGSAPVTTANASTLVGKLPHVGSVLALINEYDMVPRADGLYVRSVIDLYRSKYGLSKRTNGDEGTNSSTDGISSFETENEKTTLPTWSLPEPSCYPVGDIIVSKCILNDNLTTDTTSGLTPRPAMTYKMFQVTHETFSNLLFCGLGVHKRKVYLERIRSTLGVDTSTWSDAATLRTVGSQYSSSTV